MQSNCNSTMLPPCDCNPTICMWSWITSSQNLKLKMSKPFRLVKLVIVMVLGNVEDERTFFTLTFIKTKLKNWLTTHLDFVVTMYAQDSFTLPILHNYHWVEWREIPLWVGAINCVCDMGLFDLSILFIDRDFKIYVFCFASLPSIDIAKSIYGLRFDFLGRQRRWRGFIVATITWN